LPLLVFLKKKQFYYREERPHIIFQYLNCFAMKKIFAILIFLILVSQNLTAQQPDYRVVFDITSKDTNAHKTVIRQASGISKSDPNAEIEIVLYSQSLDMVLKDKSIVANEVQKLAANKNVAFKVCAITLKRHNIDESHLIPGVGTVPDGIYEIITKQRQGWGYIKVAQ